MSINLTIMRTEPITQNNFYVSRRLYATFLNLTEAMPRAMDEVSKTGIPGAALICRRCRYDEI